VLDLAGQPGYAVTMRHTSPSLLQAHNRIFRRAQSRIRALMTRGEVPRVTSFARLGDYLDANMLLLDANGGMDPEVERLYRRRDGVAAVNEFYGGIVKALDAWLRTHRA